jgi:hypothetical protein
MSKELEDDGTDDWCDVDGEPLTEDRAVSNWYLIRDSNLKEELLKRGEPVLETDFGDFWGRESYNTAIVCEPMFWDIWQGVVLKAQTPAIIEEG